MAKIAIEFDTVTKTFSAMVDGVAVPNAVGAEVYQTYDNTDKYRCNIMAITEDSSTGITEMRRLMASATADAKLAKDAAPSAAFIDFVETMTTAGSKAHRDIHAMFGVKE